MPFSATVEVEASAGCRRSVLAGTVRDREGEPLLQYPLHVWGAGLDTIVISGSAPAYGPSGWEVTLPGTARGIWYVQLHRYDIAQAHPPLSDIVQIILPTGCHRALVALREQP